jgi:Ras-related protein Rab-7A
MNDFFVVEKNDLARPKIKISAITVGASGVGKTSFLTRIKYNDFSAHMPPTIGVDFLACYYRIGDRNVFTQFWDTAGHERFANLLIAYIRGADLIFMMYDPAHDESIVHLHRQKAVLDDYAPHAIRILVATKADICVPNVDDLRRFAKDLGCSAGFSISSKTNANIMNCVAYSLKLVLSTWKPTKEQLGTGMKLQQTETQEPEARSSCCK